MHVRKRGNRGIEVVKFDKITARISNLCKNLSPIVDPILVAQRTVSSLVDDISTEEIDNISANVAEYMSTQHHHYGKLSARIRVSNLHKTTPATFSACMGELQEASKSRFTVATKCFAPGYDSKHKPLFKEDAMEFIMTHSTQLDSMIINDLDYKFDCIGIKTLMHNYLHKKDGKPYDRPQYMFMRVAVALYKHLYDESPAKCFNAIKKCYKRLASLQIMHATPTLFNACAYTQQLLSCFLLGVHDDISAIMNAMHNASIISKFAGGIGVHLHQIRCNGSYIHGTSGESSGLIPQSKMWNDLACAWNQGGKRKGSIALYLEPSHGDLLRFLELKLPVGDDESRAKDLFYALWMPDLFMERYLESLDNEWSFFSNNEAKNLSLVYDGMPRDMYIKLAGTNNIDEYVGEYVNPDGTLNAYTKLYLQYERAGLAIGKVRIEEIDKRILRAQRETGVPYICYKDHANRKTNHQNVGTIQSSNLCVHGDTYILTDRGQYKIGELSGQTVNVWNGREFSTVKIMQTGIDQELIRVSLSNGAYLDCTPYHKFYIAVGNGYSGKSKEVRANELKAGDKLIKYDLPVIRDGPRMKYPYSHGLFSADGTYENAGHEAKPCSYKAKEGSRYCARHTTFAKEGDIHAEMCQAISCEPHPKITLYDEKRNLAQYLDNRIPNTPNGDRKLEVRLPIDIAEKYYVPINEHIDDKLRWFEGYTDGDGTIAKNGNNYSLQACSVNLEFLSKIRLMLQTMGIDSKVTPNVGPGNRLLPDGKGGMKEYYCLQAYRLLISSNELEKLRSIGYSPNRLIVPQQNPQRNASQFVQVRSIKPTDRADTFCFAEPKRHMGMFNGILTGQCNEIYQYSDENSYACCTLMSIILSRYIVKSELGKKDSNGLYNFDPLKVIDYARIHKMVRQCVRNLNSVVDHNDYPVPQCKQNNMWLRPLGIGIQGLADLFCKLRIPFISDIARKIDIAIMETIYHAYITESAALAQQYGSYEMFEGSPVSKGILQFDMWKNNRQRRWPCEFEELFSGLYDWSEAKAAAMKGVLNSLGVALMPTVSTSQISGNNECFEPYHSNVYLKSTLGGRFIVVNGYLLEHLTELGLWSQEMRDEILANDGSVQNIESIPPAVREIYKTVWEIQQSELIMRIAMRGAFVDQSSSNNIYLRDNSDMVLRSVMRLTWSLGLKTGSYYIRTKPATNARKVASSTIRAKILAQEVTTQEEQLSQEDQESQVDACPIGCTSCSG
jgi:ribonucleoside-diphosphate reductase alpha chain